MATTRSCYTASQTQVGFATAPGRKCELKINIPLDLSAMGSIEVFQALVVNPAAFALAPVIAAYYNDVRLMGASALNGKKTALSWVHAGYSVLFIATAGGAYVTPEMQALFEQVRCFILDSKDISFDNSQYLINVAKGFYTTARKYVNVVVDPNLIGAPSFLRAYAIYLQFINVRFKCTANQLSIATPEAV